MALKLMYITNNPKIAQIAEKYSVDRIWVDLERIGKRERQRGDTVQSDHTLADVSRIREYVSKSELLVRVNSIHENSKEEIEEVIRRGADIIMLPYFHKVHEAELFLDMVHGRTKTMLLVETIGAERELEKIVNSGCDEIHIGLNDLHLEYHMKFMFELLADGKVEEMCEIMKGHGIPYGFGGIARLDEGMVPARHIIAEHYRLGSSMAILSRSFYDSWIAADLEEIERVFKYGMAEIREYEGRLMHETPEFFEENQKNVIREVEMVVRKR